MSPGPCEDTSAWRGVFRAKTSIPSLGVGCPVTGDGVKQMLYLESLDKHPIRTEIRWSCEKAGLVVAEGVPQSVVLVRRKRGFWRKKTVPFTWTVKAATPREKGTVATLNVEITDYRIVGGKRIGQKSKRKLAIDVTPEE